MIVFIALLVRMLADEGLKCTFPRLKCALSTQGSLDVFTLGMLNGVNKSSIMTFGHRADRVVIRLVIALATWA